MINPSIMGRPKIPIDAKKVEELATIGCSAQEMAAILTPDHAKQIIDHQTVERRFYATIQKGRNTLHRALKRELVKQAMSGNTAALIFALKVFCGLKEPRDDGFNVNVSTETTVLSRILVNEIEQEAKPVRDAVSSMFQKYRPALGNGNGHREAAE
jgi:hypothetical protein